GHLTLDGNETSQFEQQVRAICGLPLGSVARLRPATVMVNLLGHLWEGGEPNWAAALADPGVRLHLYGKETPKVGRKMGHLTVLDESAGAARERALLARTRLGRS
ncbi:MAG: 5-(carboxyamino)imidazole ribonucleotide synthase, partial [Planctomycetota bacterium]